MISSSGLLMATVAGGRGSCDGRRGARLRAGEYVEAPDDERVLELSELAREGGSGGEEGIVVMVGRGRRPTEGDEAGILLCGQRREIFGSQLACTR